MKHDEEIYQFIAEKRGVTLRKICNDLIIAERVADVALQRLRRAGRIQFTAGLGWTTLPTQAVS